MKNKLMLAVAAGVVAFTSLSANANSISVGTITTATDGSGGVLWTYPMHFDNSTVVSGSSYFNINDFGALKAAAVFAPGVTFTVDNTLTLGPNTAILIANNPSVLDVVIRFTQTADILDGDYNLVLDTAMTGVGGFANFSSLDEVQSGLLAGQPSQAQSVVRSPVGVPDGGATAMLLGAALSALGLIRRKLA